MAGHPKSPILSSSCLLRFPFYFERATAHLQAPDSKLRLLWTDGRLTQLSGFPETSCRGTFLSSLTTLTALFCNLTLCLKSYNLSRTRLLHLAILQPLSYLQWGSTQGAFFPLYHIFLSILHFIWRPFPQGSSETEEGRRVWGRPHYSRTREN